MILIGVAIPTVGTLMALAKTDDTRVRRQRHRPAVVVGVRLPGRRTGCGGIDRRRSSPAARWSSPTSTNVLVRGTSRDVIHCFWIPRLNGKRDMVPGPCPDVRLEADQPGIYAGQCTEFCGLSPRQHAHGGRRPRRRRLRDVEGQPARAVRGAGGGHAGRRRRGRRSSPSARGATRSTAWSTPTATR